MAYTVGSSTYDVANWLEQTWDPSIHITAYNKAAIINKFSDLSTGGSKPGGTHNVRSLANFSSNTISTTAAAGLADLTKSGTSEANTTATPTTRYVYIEIVEKTLAELIVDPEQAFRNGAEMALMEDIDADGAGLFDTLSNVVGSGASNLNSSLLLEAITTLASNAKMYWQPGTGKTAYLCVAHNQINDILADENFVRADLRGDSEHAMVSGWVHKAYGVSLNTTGNIVSSSGAYHNALFVPQAFGIGWNQRMKVVNDRDGLEVIIIPWADYIVMEKQDYLAVDIQTTTS